MKSIWESTTKLPTFPVIMQDYQTDVLIIGGGICGILCAKRLQDKGINYMLVEADRICKKTTANTTAKISALHGVKLYKLIKNVGREGALLYYRAHENAIAEYEALAKNVECDFEKTNGYVFTLDNRENIEREFKAMCDLGIEASLVRTLDIPFNALCGIKLENQGQFNPLKFASGIAKDLNIYENSRVTELIENTAIVNGYKINAKKIIVATHFPFINKHGLYFMKMYQHRSYVIAIEADREIDGIYINDNKFGLSLRQYKDAILLGGEGHRTGKQGAAWRGLEQLANEYFPGNKLLYRFATQDCIPLDGMMYAGQYSRSTPDLYVATGFDKWGMTSSMVASDILCNLISGKESPYAKLFNPSRSILKPQLAINAWESIVSLLTYGQKRCPHLGCTLKWNKHEHSWDCPCHGSRFTENNKLLDGPSNHDIIEK